MNSSASLTSSGKSDIAQDGYRLQLDAAENCLTPSTVTAAFGIANNKAFRVHPTVSNVITKLTSYTSNIGAVNFHPLDAYMRTTAENMVEHIVDLFHTHIDFSELFIGAYWHIKRGQELQSAIEFMSNIAYKDIGSGVSNISTSLDLGITSTVGSPKDLVKVMEASGSLYDYNNMQTFGTSQGVIEGINRNKLGTASGLAAALAKFNVDPTQLDDPSYAPQINNALTSITNSSSISTVCSQVGIDSRKISSFKDFTDKNKLTSQNVSGLKGDLSGVGVKFNELGATFESDILGSSIMLENIEIPNVPIMDSYATTSGNAKVTVRNLMNAVSADINNMIFGEDFVKVDYDSFADEVLNLYTDISANVSGSGLGSGPGRMPTMRDFFGIISGNPEITTVDNLGNLQVSLTTGTLNAINTSITNSKSLFKAAGLPGSTFDRPGDKLSGSLNFAVNLHRFGADKLYQDPETLTKVTNEIKNVVGPSINQHTGSSEVLKDLANVSTVFGESILAAMAEGRNRLLMQINNIDPYKYTIPHVANPFESLPKGKVAKTKYVQGKTRT